MEPISDRGCDSAADLSFDSAICSLDGLFVSLTILINSLDISAIRAIWTVTIGQALDGENLEEVCAEKGVD